MLETVEHFCRGATAMGYLVASGFFFRFWCRTGDRLFLFFFIAFLLLTVNRSILTILYSDAGENSWPYLIRLFAFLTILMGIVDKNLRRI